MEPRKELIFFGSAGILTAAVLGVGIMALNWPPVLIVLVPVFGGTLLLAAFDWFTGEGRASRRQARLERRHRRTARAH